MYRTNFSWISLVLNLIMFCHMSFGQSKDLKNDLLLENLLKQDSIFYKKYFNESNSDYEIQILYTKIDRDKKDKPIFTTYCFQEDSSNYFYPASTVKLPIAALALEKLNLLNKRNLDKYTIMISDSAYFGQTKMLKDSTSRHSYPTVSDHIKKILVYSDNNAFNRLYEFLGPDYINSRLQELGYFNTEIRHRLSMSLTIEQNSVTNPVTFLDKKGDTIYFKPPSISDLKISAEPIYKGHGYIQNGILVNEPKNFNTSNRFSLRDQHHFLKQLMIPDIFEGKRKLTLTKSDYKFLYKYMSMYPKESGYGFPICNYPDSYVKFLMYGSLEEKIPANIRIFNKVGIAYGFMIDNAYILDLHNKVEFLLTAVINVNTNKVYNDDEYSYESDGYPFFKKLGMIIYNYELNRKKLSTPDSRSYGRCQE